MIIILINKFNKNQTIKKLIINNAIFTNYANSHKK